MMRLRIFIVNVTDFGDELLQLQIAMFYQPLQ